MKATRKFIIVVSCILLAFFLTALILFVYNYYYGFIFSEYFVYNLFLFQMVVFAITACSVIVFAAISARGKTREPISEVNKIALLSEMNVLAEEYILTGRTSVLIGRNETSCISFGASDISDEYAVINRVNDFWYIERVTDERNVGLKRAGEQYVYKLKTGLCYKLHTEDIIYIDNERLLVI